MRTCLAHFDYVCAAKHALFRRVTERTIAWIDHNRRMSKGYERLPESA